MLKGFTRAMKPLETLSPEELETIHGSALFTLESTGMRVESERALKLLAEHDCRVDFEEMRVRIPAWLAEECLRRTPSHYVVTARDGRSDIVIGGDTLYFMQGMGMRHVDIDTWETRPATLQEHREATIVADALENCHMGDAVFSYTEIQGVPPVMTFLETLASGLRYSGKAQHYGYSKGCEAFAVQLANDLGINLEPELDAGSPLTIYGDAVDAAFTYVEAGIPVQPTVGSIMGAESPISTAGSLVMAAAMTMGWIVLVQLIKPGAPLSIQYGFEPMDMRTGSPVFGSVLNALGHVGMNQWLRSHEIPSCTSAGFASMSKKFDYQCAQEKGLGSLISALSGGNIHIFQGGTTGELVYDPVLSIMDDDTAGWIGRMLEGTKVTPDTLSVNLINEVGPIPGHYLSAADTREHWRDEHFFPKVADETAYPTWIQTGKKDTLDLARERMDDILATHQPLPLTDEQERAVEKMLGDARDHYRSEGLISDEEWAVYMQTLDDIN
jgi:trimethylamine--corrinoid protein Co-methyltransferase